MFYLRRSLFQILKDGVGLYCRHWWQLTQPLIFPLVAQLFGIVCWIFLTYEVIEQLTYFFPQINIWLLWFCFLLANLPGMYLFFNGFWRYLVWISGLNLMVRDLAETNHAYEKSAYYLRIISRSFDYSIIVTFVFGIVFIPFCLSMIPVALSVPFPNFYGLSIISAIVVLLLGLLVVCALLVFLCLSFQVFAFTPSAPGTTMVRSSELVKQNIFKAFLIIAVSIGMTQFFLPMALTVLFDITTVMTAISRVVEVGVHYLIQKNMANGFTLADFPVLGLVIEKTGLNQASASEMIADILVMSFTSALLLPLSTCWFALLYADLKHLLDETKALKEETPADESLITATM